MASVYSQPKQTAAQVIRGPIAEKRGAVTGCSEGVVTDRDSREKSDKGGGRRAGEVGRPYSTQTQRTRVRVT